MISPLNKHHLKIFKNNSQTNKTISATHEFPNELWSHELGRKLGDH